MSFSQKMTNWIVCCHVDKPLAEEEPHSKYDKKIQAGAALTDKRICDFNDHDDFPESISDRNRRYSELTAVFWVSKHIDSEYVGISHYRRRFDIPDEELDLLMDKGFDIITTAPVSQGDGRSVEESHKSVNYAWDWDLMMELILDIHPDDYKLAAELGSQSSFHYANMNVFRNDVFREYADWLFPVLNAFFENSPEKTDVYSKRDVGFISEFLSSVFVEKAKREGKVVIEAPVRQLRSETNAQPENIDMHDPEAVFAQCNRLFMQSRIRQCRSLFQDALDMGTIDLSNEKYMNLYEVFLLELAEQRQIPLIISDYLPVEMQSDLDHVINTYSALKALIIGFLSAPSGEAFGKLQSYIDLTRFSSVVVKNILERIPQDIPAKNILETKLQYVF
ncbi:MAG: DUF4422 domain-containing protein [Butyrivibrio sp.]|nr:DUF4422 domain-containing protein [Butyrivibrio sp.]